MWHASGCAALCAMLLGGCAYQAATIATPADDVVTSFSDKIPGKWLLYIDASNLNTTVRPDSLECSAHNFPLDFTTGFPASVRTTLPNVIEDTEDVPDPIPADQAKKQGARGIISVHGESVSANLHVVSGFWSANIATEVDISASVTIDGPSGRLFGKTFDGEGRGDAPSGLACDGGAKALQEAADRAQKELLRRMAEEIANSDRVRMGRVAAASGTQN